jgi:ParB-like chromosome segregation protein Spo0J
MASAELDEHIRRLADSIKEIGVAVPLKIRMKGNVPVVVNGHCRLAAVMLAIKEKADIKSIPVFMEERNSSEEDRVLSMITCNEGKPLSILEQASVYKRLVGWGWKSGEIAKKSGYSVTHIDSCLLLGGSDAKIRKLVSDGKVSATLAIKLIGEKGEKEALAEMTSAVEFAKAIGKEKATKKDIGGRKEPGLSAKRADWKKWGPKLFHVLESICVCPASGKGSERLGDYMAEGNTLIQEMEDAGYTGKE